MRILLYLFSLILLSSCSAKLTPFSQRLYDEFSWTEGELKNIQFYLSEDIVLWREAGLENSIISSGKIRIRDGREVEEVRIKRGTPGVMVFSPKKNRFAISFDESDEKYLMFGPNPKANGRFVLLGKEWNKRTGKVTYNGRTYNTQTENAFATLLVDIKSARKVNYKSSTARGRKIETD